MPELALVDLVARSVRRAAKVAPDRPIHADSLLVDDLGVDSLDLVGVVLEVQEEFAVDIADDDVARVRTVADLAACVAAARAA